MSIGAFHRESAWRKRTSSGKLEGNCFLALKLICCHEVAHKVQLSRSGDHQTQLCHLGDFCIDHSNLGENRVRYSHSRKNISVVGIPAFGNKITKVLNVGDCTVAVHIELKVTVNAEIKERRSLSR